MKSTKFSYDTYLRYQFIEIIVFWEGRLNTNHLTDNFHISRQQASKIINAYHQNIAPNNLVYDAKLKGYHATDQFKPLFSQGFLTEYLDVIKDLNFFQSIQGGCFLPNKTHQSTQKIKQNWEILKPASRMIKPKILQTLIRAFKNQTRIEVSYASIQNPSGDDRIISPHTLVFTGFRWHVRAYCEKSGMFKDFVLSRFKKIIDDDCGQSNNTIHKDTNWHTFVNIIVKPDIRLTHEKKQLIEMDYGMTKGQLKIKTRGPLVQYTLQLLQIDPNTLKGKPSAQQIYVENLEELDIWLFKG
jgi:predicted DNA-binding transcriptional regulator YafY